MEVGKWKNEMLEVKNETSREKFDSCEDFWKSVSFETVR